MAPFSKAYNLDRVIAYSPVIILWGEPLESRPIDFVTTNINRYGYTVADILMRESPFDSLVLEEDRERVRTAFLEALKDGRDSLVMDYRIVDSEGKAHWVEDRIVFYRNERGETVLYQSCLMDITIRKQAEERCARSEERVALLREMSMTIMEELDSKTLVNNILEKAVEFTGAFDGLISVIEADGEHRSVISGLGLFEFMKGDIIPLDQGLQARVIREKRRIVVDDYRSYPGRIGLKEFDKITTIATIPLHRGDRLLGTLSIAFRDEVKAFDEQDVEQLDQFAAAASIALDNSRLYEEARREAKERERAEREVTDGYVRLQKTFVDVIRTMGKIIGKKDPYTIEHQERVAALAAELCRRMGFGDERSEGVRITGLVHDIGKIVIPGEILSKPGRLSEFEFELIKTHVRSGYDILKEVEFPWPVAMITCQHHERLDGSGYPLGLKGDEILHEARILAVADVVEAMMSHRPYRPSLGLDAALDEIRRGRGVLYAPEVVDACLALFDERPGFIDEQ